MGLMARWALTSADGGQHEVVEPGVAALLTAPIILSSGTFLGIDVGSLSFLVTFGLMLAIAVRGRGPGNPALAAAGLAAATIKPQTMIPFLLLFLHRRDRRVCLYLLAFVAGLVLCAVHPADLPRELATMLTSVARLKRLGQVNDYSDSNPHSVNMIGIDRALSCIGFGDRLTIMSINALALACLGFWLAYVATWRPVVPRSACCSLVSLYSVLFLYHRNIDLTILIIPLIYSAGRFLSNRGPLRWCYAWVITAVVLSINVPLGLFRRVQGLGPTWGILRAFVLPWSTYLVLSAIAALALATRLEWGSPRNPIPSDAHSA